MKSGISREYPLLFSLPLSNTFEHCDHGTNGWFSEQVVRALEGDMISFDDLNEGVKPGQSLHFGSASDESGTYSAKMREFQKMALASGEYTGEYGQYSGTTGDYRLNQSSESASSSSGETNSAAGRKPHQ